MSRNLPGDSFNGKETYPDKKSDYFKKLRKMMTHKGYGKAKAELEASKDPIKYMNDSKNMSIKGLKGIGF